MAERWVATTIGELAQVKGGKRLPAGTSLQDAPTPHPYLRVTDMYNGGVYESDLKFVPIAAAPAISAYRIGADDIFISVAGSLGIVGRVPASLDGANLTENADRLTNIKCDVDYLMYYLLSEPIQNEIDSIRTVGAQPKLALGRIKSFEVKLPASRTDQARISGALRGIDELIHALVGLIGKKQAIKEGVVQRMLSGTVRLPGFTRPWMTASLADVADGRDSHSLVGGPFGSSLTSSEYTVSGVRILQLQNIGDGRFCEGYAVFTSSHKADRLKTCNIYPGDVLIAKMGDPVARACLVPGGADRYVMSSDGIRLAVDERRYDRQLVKELINARPFRDAAEAVSSGSTRKRITLSALRHLTLLLPTDLDEQRAVGGLVADLDGEIDVLERRLEAARAIKQGMMQELLTGRTRLGVEGDAA